MLNLYIKSFFVSLFVFIAPFGSAAENVNGVFFKEGINWIASEEGGSFSKIALLGHSVDDLKDQGFPFFITFIIQGSLNSTFDGWDNEFKVNIDGRTYSIYGKIEVTENYYQYSVDPLSSFQDLDAAMRAGNRITVSHLHDNGSASFSLSGYTKTSNSYFPQNKDQQSSSNVASTQADWVVFMEESPKECWAASQPVEMVTLKNGKLTAYKRADILLFVSYIPGSGIKGQISFTGGYSFADGSNVDVNIDGASYQMFTNGEWAWTPTVKVDEKMLQALKRGQKAVFTARSKDGVKSIDTFSLKGFTAAVLEAAKRCN